ncbi:MAG: carboxymuconolactone decarboxylase family protein [Alphaproteobacteria bacterium]|nr:carboxymuconolactone decarboxylase family protein [Alphaproteobacteria bacterium]
MVRKKQALPTGASTLARRHPDVWESFAELGERCAGAGPLDARTRRLIKLALAAGAGLEGAVHSHARRALEENIGAAEIRHVALLAIPTLGLSTAVRAMTWIDDVLPANPPRKNQRRR